MYVLTCVILTNLLKATNFLFQFLDSVTFDDNIFFVKELNYDILPFFFLLFHEEFYVRDYCLGPDSRWLNCVWCHTCNQGTSIMMLVTVCNNCFCFYLNKARTLVFMIAWMHFWLTCVSIIAPSFENDIGLALSQTARVLGPAYTGPWATNGSSAETILSQNPVSSIVWID